MSISRLIFHNFWIKTVSLVIAVLLWWAVARDPRVEVVLTVPIEFHHVPPELEISAEKVPQAEIRLRGPARMVRELSAADIHPIIDLQGASVGERTFDLTPRQISLPHDVDVEQIVPSQFRVSFDRRVSREVEVRPRVIGTFASGFRISEAAPKPSLSSVPSGA